MNNNNRQILLSLVFLIAGTVLIVVAGLFTVNSVQVERTANLITYMTNATNNSVIMNENAVATNEVISFFLGMLLVGFWCYWNSLHTQLNISNKNTSVNKNRNNKVNKMSFRDLLNKQEEIVQSKTSEMMTPPVILPPPKEEELIWNKK